VRRSMHEIWNRRMFNRIDDYYAANYLYHGTTDREYYGRGNYTAYILSVLAMFPDAAMFVDDLRWVGLDWDEEPIVQTERLPLYRAALGRLARGPSDAAQVPLYGSGDFHHVSLALLHRHPGPFNLLIIDKHPDWMRGVPVMHCGSWVAQALRLGVVRHVFHAGGAMDFDNHYRVLAPWRALQEGRLAVFPAARPFRAR